MYGECWRTGKEEWAQICCAALTAWDGGSRWDISLSRLDGCGNERTRKLKATKPCNQFLSSTLAIHLVLQSCLVFPNILANGFGHSAPCPHQSSLWTVLPCQEHTSSTERAKLRGKKKIFSPFLPCVPSGKIATIQTEHASKALETWGCSTSPERSSRDCDTGEVREWRRKRCTAPQGIPICHSRRGADQFWNPGMETASETAI